MNGKAGLKVIVGLGDTGLACARFLTRQNIPVAITDSRKTPPRLKNLKKEVPCVKLALGAFSETLLNEAAEIIVSPGVSLKEPEIAQQIYKGKSVIGDIELFMRHIRNPVLAITGSNGKTTVSTLLGLMLKEAEICAPVCGNIGEPVLNHLVTPEPDYYVIELSSFQLETTYSLNSMAATILNVSPDHMDRYASYQEYLDAKQRIYRNCLCPVVNADEPRAWKNLKFSKPPIQFSLINEKADFSLLKRRDKWYLARRGKLLIATNKLKLNARHHLQNALAALAMSEVINLPIESRLNVLRNFAGLPHRCQWVRKLNDVNWYNDSKGTNVGATRAAIESLGTQIKGKLILIVGGQGKGADFSALQKPIKHYVKHTVLIGEDAPILEKILSNTTQLSHVNSLRLAVELAQNKANPGDAVLLSPACASFDMFNDFKHRGDVFIQAVEAL